MDSTVRMVHFTSEGNTAADWLANCIAEAAAKHLPSMKLRGDYSDGDIDYEDGFYILKHTMCSAVLTENGYMTNEKECRWLQTEEAIEAIVCDARGRDYYVFRR